MTIVSSSCERGFICKVGTEVTCPADPRLEESRVVWARDGSSCRGLGAIFPCLPAQFGWFQISWRPRRLRLSTSIYSVLQLPKSHGRW